MARKADYVVPYRRKREGKTDYKTRLDLLKSETTRLVVRPSNKHIRVQLVDYKRDGDVVVSTVCSQDLAKYGWKQSTGNIPAAYLTGYLCGMMGKKKGITKAIADLGLLPSIVASRNYAAIKGALDAGLKMPVDESICPDEKRIGGEHIAAHGKADITKEFNEVKKKITEEFKK